MNRKYEIIHTVALNGENYDITYIDVEPEEMPYKMPYAMHLVLPSGYHNSHHFSTLRALMIHLEQSIRTDARIRYNEMTIRKKAANV